MSWSNISAEFNELERSSLFANLSLPGEVPEFVPIILYVYLTIVFIIGVPGNVIIAVIYYWTRPKKACDWLIFFISLMDTVVCFVAPPSYLRTETGASLPFGSTLLCSLETLVMIGAVFASCIMLNIIAAERYIKICHPTLSTMKAKTSRNTCIVVIIIGLGFASYPSAIMYREKYCRTVATQYSNTLRIYHTVIFFFFVVSFFIVTFAYGSVCRKISQKVKLKQRLIQNEGLYSEESGAVETTRRCSETSHCSLHATVFSCCKRNKSPQEEEAKGRSENGSNNGLYEKCDAARLESGLKSNSKDEDVADNCINESTVLLKNNKGSRSNITPDAENTPMYVSFPSYDCHDIGDTYSRIYNKNDRIDPMELIEKYKGSNSEENAISEVLNASPSYQKNSIDDPVFNCCQTDGSGEVQKVTFSEESGLILPDEDSPALIFPAQSEEASSDVKIPSLRSTSESGNRDSTHLKNGRLSVNDSQALNIKSNDDARLVRISTGPAELPVEQLKERSKNFLISVNDQESDVGTGSDSPIVSPVLSDNNRHGAFPASLPNNGAQTDKLRSNENTGELPGSEDELISNEMRVESKRPRTPDVPGHGNKQTSDTPLETVCNDHQAAEVKVKAGTINKYLDENVDESVSSSKRAGSPKNSQREQFSRQGDYPKQNLEFSDRSNCLAAKKEACEIQEDPPTNTFLAKWLRGHGLVSSKKSESSLRSKGRNSSKRWDMERRMTLMLVSITAVFLISMFPPWIIYLYYMYQTTHVSNTTIDALALRYFDRIHLINFMANPIIYTTFNPTFRAKVKHLLTPKLSTCWCCGRRGHTSA